MLSGSRIGLVVRAPDIATPITRPVESIVSKKAVEFRDVQFFDLSGDPYEVVRANLDFGSDSINYRIIDTEFSSFADVDNESGFNGYSISFAKLGNKTGPSLRAADIAGGKTSLQISQSDITFGKKALFINVDGLEFEFGDTLELRLGFKISGGQKADSLQGFRGRDLIEGGSGKDTLDGGDGNDQLIGDFGKDRLTGDGGADRFIYKKISDSTVKAAGRDVITDFGRKERDKIDVSAIDAKSGGGNQAFRFVGEDAFSGRKGELRYDQTSKKTIVYGDVNGDAAADFSIELTGRIDLTNGSFIL